MSAMVIFFKFLEAPDESCTMRRSALALGSMASAMEKQTMQNAQKMTKFRNLDLKIKAFPL